MAYSILSTFFGYTLYLLIHLGIIGGYQDHQNGLSNARRPNSLASWPKMIPLSIQETSTLEMSSSARYHIEKVQFICSSWPQSPTVTMQKSWVNTSVWSKTTLLFLSLDFYVIPLELINCANNSKFWLNFSCYMGQKLEALLSLCLIIFIVDNLYC